jgi:CrcB protein
MTGRRWGLVAFGGAVGATTRWAVLELWAVTGGFPWPVFALNVFGSVVVGAVMGDDVDRAPTPSTAVHDAVGLGFCGGLTTFSTFAVEVVVLQRQGDPAIAVAYVAASVVAAIVGVLFGAARSRGSLPRPAGHAEGG